MPVNQKKVKSTSRNYEYIFEAMVKFLWTKREFPGR